MPYQIDSSEGIKKIPLLAQAAPFRCQRCDCDSFSRDMFSPYHTEPDRGGYFDEHILAECAKCGRIYRWTFVCHVDDWASPSDWASSTVDNTEISF